ncbi:MAG TPA: hypothetical protein VFY45_02985 [Baekduia sp.]|nr:hypothetical protein [Baekduia sp.]
MVAAASAYVIATLIALLLPSPAKGWAVLAVSSGGCAGLVALARVLDRPAWSAALGVLIPISIFQLVPDWFLADALGTLNFPDTGGIRVGGVIPLAMCGMWALPLFLVVLIARDSIARGALAAFVLFLGTELAAPTAALWEPAGDVTKIAGVALYVLPAEAVLGAATVLAVRATRDRPLGERMLAAAVVSTLYTGALVLCWFFIDQAALTLSA